MRILYHHRTLGDGAEGIHIQEMVDSLRRIGHEVEVVSLIGDKTNTPTNRMKLWRSVSRMLPAVAYEFAEIFYNYVGSRRILRAIKEFRPDFVYDRYNSYNAAALIAAKRAGLPLLLEVNAPVAYERTVYENLKLKLPRLARRYEKKICLGANRIFVVSTPLKDYLVNKLGIPQQKIVVLPNGANPEKFDPAGDSSAVRAQFGFENCTVIGFVGILRPWHGIDLLLEAFARQFARDPQLRLLIVGDGPIQNELESLAATKGLTAAVRFTGRVPHSQMCQYVAAMDIAVSPRATFYASPMKILEYMAVAKPVVAPDMPNIRDIIAHGLDGMLFEPESVDSLSAQLELLLKDKTLRAEMGRAARRKIETQLNWDSNAREVIDAGLACCEANFGRNPRPVLVDDRR